MGQFLRRTCRGTRGRSRSIHGAHLLPLLPRVWNLILSLLLHPS